MGTLPSLIDAHGLAQRLKPKQCRDLAIIKKNACFGVDGIFARSNERTPVLCLSLKVTNQTDAAASVDDGFKKLTNYGRGLFRQSSPRATFEALSRFGRITPRFRSFQLRHSDVNLSADIVPL